MATAAHSIEQIAAVTGAMHATVFRAARALREADVSLWPQGSQGRGRGAHVEVPHLINLILALGCADPITTAPVAVPTLRVIPAGEAYGWLTHPMLGDGERKRRGCTFGAAGIALDGYRDALFPGLPKVERFSEKLKSLCWYGEGDPRCYQILPGNTAGEALDSFVNYLALPEGKPLRVALRKAGWRLTIDTTGHIETSYNEEGMTFSSYFHRPDRSLAPSAFVKVASFGLEVFETLADLWADTKGQAQGSSHSSSPENPESENAAPGRAAPSNTSLHPGQGTTRASQWPRQP